MERILSILEPFVYEKGNSGCSCHETIKFQHGDHLYILGEPFFVETTGWYIAVSKNEESPFYMSIPFIDDMYEECTLYTEMDLDLAINFHQYQIEQSLINKNKKDFLHHKHSLDRLTAVHPTTCSL